MCKTDNPEVWECTNHTTYKLCFNKDSSEKLTVPYGHDDLCIEAYSSAYETLLDFKLGIADDILRLKKADGRLSLVPEDTNEYYKDPIEIDSYLTTEGNSERQGFNVLVEIPDSLTEMFNEFIVSIRRVQLINRFENQVTSRVGLPTKDVYTSCNIDSDNYLVNCASFGIDTKRHVIDRGRNFASANIKEWILPGHGAVMTWREVECSLTEPAQRAGEIVQKG